MMVSGRTDSLSPSTRRSELDTVFPLAADTHFPINLITATRQASAAVMATPPSSTVLLPEDRGGEERWGAKRLIEISGCLRPLNDLSGWAAKYSAAPAPHSPTVLLLDKSPMPVGNNRPRGRLVPFSTLQDFPVTGHLIRQSCSLLLSFLSCRQCREMEFQGELVKCGCLDYLGMSRLPRNASASADPRVMLAPIPLS